MREGVNKLKQSQQDYLREINAEISRVKEQLRLLFSKRRGLEIIPVSDLLSIVLTVASCQCPRQM